MTTAAWRRRLRWSRPPPHPCHAHCRVGRRLRRRPPDRLGGGERGGAAGARRRGGGGDPPRNALDGRPRELPAGHCADRAASAGAVCGRQSGCRGGLSVHGRRGRGGGAGAGAQLGAGATGGGGDARPPAGGGRRG
ncbi:hypothetical protein BU14_0312s0002 [Porphyra umbilicalis]|uniref:Uncharacterized protein n=1 Tax=Porphyra umbilicalis TaxID=2786 RepID=A0A1X6NZL0_PORUM|nr:hypothetical protein BU14_0312s0002 [Porphyra umbilicalis]|eukprot:OSX74048.1 hypothetical protein BU14_0312s0002 [Porphyra umbilicalis]